MPEDIDKKKYGFWRLETLPIIPEQFELQPLPEGKERFGQLKKLLARKDVTKVINACDAGREGELIFTYIYQLTKCKKPFQRLWMSSMTNEGIREALKHLRSAEQMQGLADAARCRSEADWLIGINGTRALTKRMFGAPAPAMSPPSAAGADAHSLAIVYNRELEIRNFKPRGYWRITAKFGIAKGEYEGLYQRPDFKKNDDEHDRIDRLWNQEQAEAILAKCQGQPIASVTEEKKASTSIAPRLYDLTTLQREANGRFGFPAKRTLQIAQALYERHKMITYPRVRTPGRPAGGLHPARPPDARQPAAATLKSPCAARARLRLGAAEQAHLQQRAGFGSLRHHPDRARGQEPRRGRGQAVRHDRASLRGHLPSGRGVRHHHAHERTVATHAFKTEGKVLTSPGWLAVYGKTTDDESADAKALPALSAEDKAKAKTLSADLHSETTKPPPRATSEATLLSAMEGAGKLVDDEELAEAMKERGLGTPATRADTIEGLVNQKYIDRNQRELVPTTKAEQLFQFLGAVKIENLTSPAMTGGWEFELREMEHGKFPREKFMAGIVKETKDIVAAVKGFEEDDSVARTTDIISPTDGKPLRETLRGYKSQDGELMVYKIIGGRRMEEAEVKQLVETRQAGPLDGFISNKTRNRFSAVLKLALVEETKKDKATKQDVVTKKWKTEFDFGDKVDIGTLTPFWTDPKTGAELCESGSSYILREKNAAGAWEQTFRLGRIMCQKPIPAEQAIKLVGEGKTDLIENFTSKKGRPFSAFLKREGPKFSWEFPPRAPKLDKDGNPIVRKPKAKADLSKATVIGESKSPAGQLVELGDAYYVRKPDQDNRQVFKLSKKLCEIEIPSEQVLKLLEDGRSDLIENFVSKRGNKFSAYLVLSQKQDKAEFEFPPR